MPLDPAATAFLDDLRATCAQQGIAPSSSPHDTIRLALPDVLDSAGGDVPATLQTWQPDASDGEVAPPVGEALELGAALGKGGMGLVRVAVQRSLDREVAVKHLRPDRRTPVAVEALLREARMAGRLEHPNVVPIHSLRWSAEEGPVLVMKRIHGRSWTELLRDDALPLERHLEILMEVCRAVHFAHTHDVVHRDVKPDNVMVGDFGEVYLLDWGVAERDGAGAGGSLVGTPAYMAPEMARRETVSPATDVFLLGACLFEAVTGGPPHAGGSVVEVLARAAAGLAPRLPGELPDELAQILRRAMAPRPEERFQSAEALREALVDFLAHRGAVRTADRAMAILDELRALRAAEHLDPEQRRVALHTRFSACRFGFEQALEEWPESRVARRGLQEALELMIDLELEEGDPRSAEVLLAVLPARRPALEARLAAVRVEAERRAQAAARLAQVAHDQRIQGADWTRSAVTLGNAVVTMLVLVGAGAWVRARGGEVDPWTSARFVAWGWLALVACVLPFRRSLLDTRIYGRAMVVLLSIPGILLLDRALAAQLHLGFHPLLVMDCAAVTAVNVTMAASFHRMFAVSAGIAAACTLAVARTPGWGLELIGVAYLLNGLWIAWSVRPDTEL